MESNENYNRQHQDIRVENGIKYGDVIEGVDFEYAKKLTQVNAICLALLGWSPPPPSGLRIGGIQLCREIHTWCSKCKGGRSLSQRICL